MTPESTESTGSTAAATKSQIFVVSNTFGLSVVPPVFALSPGETFQIRNLTNFNLLARFPNAIVAGGKDVEIAAAGSPGDRRPVTTRGDGVGSHEYTVEFTSREGESLFARGGSNPRIVFD
jgi:hypothetical protein